jgi:hypothetical protein
LITKFIAKPNRSDVPLSLSIFPCRVFHYLAVVRKAERKPFAEIEVSDVIRPLERIARWALGGRRGFFLFLRRFLRRVLLRQTDDWEQRGDNQHKR